MFLKRKGLITVQANQLVIGHVNTVDEVRDMWGEGGGGVWFNRVNYRSTTVDHNP